MDWHHALTCTTWRTRAVGQLKTALSNLLLQNHCLLCGSSATTLLCDPCIDELPVNTSSCQRCDLPLARGALCGECLTRPPSFERAICAFEYGATISLLINRLKHRNTPYVGHFLADFLVEKIRLESAQAIDLLVPVPLYWRDQRRRGYNQAAVITAQLSQKLQVPVVHALSKPRSRPHQQQLSRAQRLRDIRGVFTTTAKLSGKHVGLVDDVITTGATVEAISSQLIRAGAKSVTVFALARTPKDR